MANRPLALLVAELGMHAVNRLVLLPLRRLVVGEDAWSEFYEDGHDGHPWWWYEDAPDGHLVLVGPIGALRGPPVPTPPAAPRSRPATGADGTSVPLSCGRVTTPIPGYRPEIHDELVDQLDLLCTLFDGRDTAAASGSSQRPRLSPSLAARAWGTRTRRSQRRADAYVAALGAAGILERTAVGSRAEWHVPADALERFRVAHGFTVAD
ncbi:MAG: hypothetical protein M0Z49_14545 [Chloroflexi bacterium]|nr:hypothetical protein [Chloroflexota bacterium]